MRANKEQETPDLAITTGPNYHVRGGELRLKSYNAQGVLLRGPSSEAPSSSCNYGKHIMKTYLFNLL